MLIPQSVPSHRSLTDQAENNESFFCLCLINDIELFWKNKCEDPGFFCFDFRSKQKNLTIMLKIVVFSLLFILAYTSK